VFYPNIAAERAKRRMSVDALAEKLGVTRKTIYNWESAGKIPQVALEKMADLFGCTIDYLLEEGEE
jgi:transcriptional regulator with XRE-family HTH domain